MKQYDVKDVAIYLRKSRGEEEDLIKHKTTLEELCKNNSWRYVLYSEIGTSDSITLRPEMVRLLDDVKEELYDAVLVMDLDRLSRGDSEDQGKIKNTLRNAETLIITPQRIYDLSDDGDDMMSDFEGLMARYEYKQIKKRFKRGKRMGTKLGKWTTGFPPFPYVNSPDKNGLLINPDEYPVYRRMVDMVVKEGMRPINIANQFNNEGLRTRNGSMWGHSTVHRILKNEVTLGKVIGSKWVHKDGTKRLAPRDKWIVVENCHQPVITQEEFDRVQEIVVLKYLYTKQKRTYRLRGIIQCAKCGSTMSIDEWKSGESLKACSRKDPFGNTCGNKGGNTKALESLILNSIKEYSVKLKQAKGQEYVAENYEQTIQSYEKELKTLNSKLSKIDNLVEEDYYTIEEARKRKSSILSKVDEIESVINDIKKKIQKSDEDNTEEKISKVDTFFKRSEADELDKQAINNFYKSLINKVVWKKETPHSKPEVSIIFN